MITRRSIVSLTGAGVAAATLGIRPGLAQTESDDVQVQNASFIRDLTATPSASPAATPESTPVTEIDSQTLRGYIIGDPDAPNTLQLFSDYRCPHCRAFHIDFEPGLMEDFVLTGRMNIEHIDFTVVGVSSFEDLTDNSIESVQAAEAAACAAEQGAYLAYRDWLFEGELRTSPGDFSDDNLIAAAESLDLDTDQFAESLLNGVYEEGVIAMFRYAVEHGVGGTPTLILNGGEPFFAPADGYEALKESLEAELN